MVSFPRTLLALAQVALFAAASVVKRQATTCNGHSELCSRGYGQVSYVGAHNSYAVDAESLSANQEYDVIQQLTDGIRLLQLQAHLDNGSINLCHESCFLYQGGTLLEYLEKVKGWLDENPTEVVSILIVNRNNLSAASFAAVYEAAGLVDISYAPPVAVLGFSEWPTLGELIDSGKRLVTFLDNSADQSVIPYIIDEFSNIWETAFDVTTQDFPCTVNRTTGDPNTQMYLINHFLYTNTDIVGAATSIAPNKDELLTTNAVSGFGSLGQEVETCVASWSRPPTFLLVDFYHYGGGSVFQVAAQVNGVEYSPSSPVPDPLEGGSTSNGDDDVTTRPLNGALSIASPTTGATALLGSLIGAWVAFV